MAKIPSMAGDLSMVFLKPRHVSFALNMMSFRLRLLRMRSSSSAVLRTCAAAGVVLPGSICTAKPVELGVVMGCEAATPRSNVPPIVAVAIVCDYSDVATRCSVPLLLLLVADGLIQ